MDEESTSGKVVTRSIKQRKLIEKNRLHDGLTVVNHNVSQLANDNMNATDDNLSQASGSVKSERSDLYSAKLKLVRAQVVKKKLEEKLELERKLKMIEAEQEIELAQLECRIIEDFDNLSTLQPETSLEKVDTFLRDNVPKSNFDASCLNNNHIEFNNEIKQPSTVMNHNVLPKLEMTTFDGQPKFYWSFIRQFDSIISSKVTDRGQLLSYLLYYCRGKAKSAIEACVILPVELGYGRARLILQELFGQGHMVARAHIDELIRSAKTVNNSADDLTEFATKLRNGHITLSQMGFVADLDSPVNLENIVSRLPMELQSKWVEVADGVLVSGREPNFDDLTKFVESRARLARTRYGILLKQNQSMRDYRKGQSSEISLRRSNVNVLYGDNIPQTPRTMTSNCCLCKQQHKLHSCPEFLRMDVSKRRDEIRRLGVCYRCLKRGHLAKNCLSKESCSVSGCHIPHHHLLHRDTVGSSRIKEAEVNHVQSVSRPDVYFGVLPVRLYGPAGEVDTYAFLDSGSDTSLISDKIVNRLGLDGSSSVLRMTTLNGTTNRVCRRVSLELFSLNGNDSVKVPKAYTVDTLPLGNISVPAKEEFDRWEHLRDVPISELSDKAINILIGNDVPDAHWALEQRFGSRKQPFARKTHLGWVVMGPSGNREQDRASYCLCAQQCEIMIDYERLYDHEFSDLESFKRELSIEDKQALAIAESTQKFVDGHYELGIPWKPSRPNLPDNFWMANRRLECLRKRFNRDEVLLRRYNDVMEGHLSKGYIVEVPNPRVSIVGSRKWYIPHHPVINPKKPEKLRIVFDCAASHQGVSLNDQILQGPNVVNSLVGVLLRFRRKAVALAADIEEMFLQVKIPEVDRGAFRLLWWKNGDTKQIPTEYQLTVHPFGAVSSPFCANFALRKAVDTFSPNNTGQMHLVDECFYVDDCLASVDDRPTAIQFIQQTTEALRKGGFRLTKWMSNDFGVIESVSEVDRAPTLREMDFEKTCVERTLGLYWDTKNDTFVCKIKCHDKPVTRRSILSSVASIYDPLGFLAPFVLPAKQLLQRLCKEKLGWDDTLSVDEQKTWIEWSRNMDIMNEVAIPRCLNPMKTGSQLRVQLHVFSDASEVGYGTVAYMRYENPDGSVICSLIMAKARVAPLKPQTIPRLELTAAVLGAKISDVIQTELNMRIDETYYWTDSTVVLHYINNTSTRFRTFVANRLTTILGITKPDQWKYVPSEHNVADYVSRGLTPDREHLRIWREGPTFLTCQESTWTKYVPATTIDPNTLEIKETAHINVTSICSSLIMGLSCYSQWSRALKSVVWLTRFKTYLMSRFSGRADIFVPKGLISPEEIEKASIDIVRLIQNTEFDNELKYLSSITTPRKPRCQAMRLARLDPILVDGTLRVGGRLTNSSWPNEKKHPLILPQRHHITDLIIRHYHILEGHVGASQLLSSIRDKFWILQGGVAIRRVLSRCIECKKIEPKLGSQIMAPLPQVRVEAGEYPFTSVGIDFFGPIPVKRGRVREKRYGCIFTCLKMRAVHLEITHSMTSDSFIMALMRFISRRGYPIEIFSDNGSNIVGAKNELKLYISEWSQTRINDFLLQNGIAWHFNPPSASHWGGAWERMIRSVRRILNTLSREQVMTDECLLTFMTEAERIVNNRPITPVTSDARDLGVLTPSKLLLLRDNSQLDSWNNLNQYSRRWKMANYLAGVFWKRWTKEYVSGLQQRQKWLRRERNFRSGDLVLVCCEKNARGRWPLGLIVEVFAGTDGLVRSADIKTEKGNLIRDIRKLCLLEAADE